MKIYSNHQHIRRFGDLCNVLGALLGSLPPLFGTLLDPGLCRLLGYAMAIGVLASRRLPLFAMPLFLVDLRMLSRVRVQKDNPGPQHSPGARGIAAPRNPSLQSSPTDTRTRWICWGH